MRQMLAGLLGSLIVATTACTAQAESIDDYRQFIVVGRTSQEDIRQILGTPPETVAEADVDIWVYNDKTEIPFFVSLLPVVGDIADAIVLVRNIRGNHELIIQFDRQGIVRKAKLRELD